MLQEISKVVCRVLPPIISQRIRSLLYPRLIALNDNLLYCQKSVTCGFMHECRTSDFHGYVYFFHGYYDLRNILIAKAVLNKFPGNIVEVGANVGTETVSLCDLAKRKNKCVYAFEPLPSNIYWLDRICKINKNLTNLNIYPLALSNIEGYADFLVPPIEESGVGKLVINNNLQNKKTIRVKIQSLDSLSNIEDITLITIDVEGHEPFVLEGAKKTIEKNRPVIILEISPKLLKNYSDSNSQKILKFFERLEYNCFQIGRYKLKLVNQIQKDFEKKTSNWVCIPREKCDIKKSINYIFLKLWQPLIRL